MMTTPVEKDIELWKPSCCLCFACEGPLRGDSCRSDDRQQQVGHWRVFAGEAQTLLTNSIRIPRLVNVCTSRRRPSKLRARRSKLCTTTGLHYSGHR